MSETPHAKTLLVETIESPIRFNVAIKNDGNRTWKTGSCLLHDKRFFTAIPLAGRITEAKRLLKWEEILEE